MIYEAIKYDAWSKFAAITGIPTLFKMELKTFSLELPQSQSEDVVTIETGQSVVIIGANGSGKTRLGTWIEFQSSQKDLVHRISAQKSLAMPYFSATSSLEVAELGLRFGTRSPIGDEFSLNTKNIERWKGRPNTHLLNDFENLMVYLFTEHFEKANEYFQSSQLTDLRLVPPLTKLEIIKKIWERYFSYRELKISAGRVQTRVKDNTVSFYNASEMSDGERVVFYLIGQALSASENGIIIIDEPELHLHKSIQTRLWRELQAARPDCLFIYMTHDVEFAASLTEAKKIWLKSFDGTFWEWDEVLTIEGFPEELLIQILGSRRPILFVEGENGSYDAALFQAIYSEHTVIPRGSCSQVTLATKALRQATQFHHLQAHGIVDRDRMNPDEINRLKTEGVEVLSVAEIENLFCVPEILKLIAIHQNLPADAKLVEAQNFVFRKLQKEIDVQVSMHAANEIKFQLNVFDTKCRGAEALKAELESRVDCVDVDAIYNEAHNQFNDVIQRQDYVGVLRLYNRKGLSNQLSGIFEIKNLPAYVLRMVQSTNRTEWVQAFQNYVPNFE